MPGWLRPGTEPRGVGVGAGSRAAGLEASTGAGLVSRSQNSRWGSGGTKREDRMDGKEKDLASNPGPFSICVGGPETVNLPARRAKSVLLMRKGQGKWPMV